MINHKETKLVYGLYHIKEKKVLGFYEDHHGSAFSSGASITLSLDNDKIWETKSHIIASYVRCFSTPWYNSGSDTPINPFKKDSLIVVEMESATTIRSPAKPIQVPTVKEFYQKHFANEPAHLNYVLEMLSKDSTLHYTLHDLLLSEAFEFRKNFDPIAGKYLSSPDVIKS